ncbi:pre-toxin TG domain-containing protein [Parageobacillus thermoglucosidasius]|uniref:pre-toxin TG domain-containing protein n=1 Tax=Parageobacillus thermoglucosidasius TaxID=1426 RepID=UPI002E2161A3|nr:pre-toxin TG domain-containing protein [Parageobacillus thermoglucosidasius]MED4915289.1 pre-toxin TG domain-containing protein [Parageobacillus thermoglucosidasius]MED4943990.1 pre-toxin TG domain-containing protein [Parageobacillus thermoglucosidasius]MED4982823.1 pre-toxin TG domain-containing protein [Parageobacillus thermoglucosidasius]
MTTIRVKPEELETVAKHIPDAEDACCRARISLSWELPSLVMEIPGISSAAIHELTDELLYWLRRYEEKLNEAEELLYRTAAAIRQADQTLADNMKELGLELLGWHDLQRLFGEYDPITGKRISGWDRLFTGGMLLLSVIPPAKGAAIAGKAGSKGAKAAETAADVSKLISQTKYVLRYDKVMPALQTVYHQVVKAPITQTIRSFKKQWENLLENVGSVLQGPQPALAGVGGPAPRMGISEAEREAKGTMMNIVGKNGDEVVGKGTGNARPSWRQSEIDIGKEYPEYSTQKSFKNGKEVPYGTKGSSRPDYYKKGFSIEVKNYKITTPEGRSRLVNNISTQFEKRLSDLPRGTKQTVIIDIRGQNVSEEILDDLYDKIMKKTNGKVNIRFKTDE